MNMRSMYYNLPFCYCHVTYTVKKMPGIHMIKEYCFTVYYCSQKITVKLIPQ